MWVTSGNSISSLHRKNILKSKIDGCRKGRLSDEYKALQGIPIEEGVEEEIENEYVHYHAIEIDSSVEAMPANTFGGQPSVAVSR